MCGWVLGRWGVLSRPPRTRRTAYILAGLLLAGGIGTALSQPPDIDWKTYSPELVEELRAQGKPFFINFTAAWCLTCQANKKVAIQTKAVQQKFKDTGVTLVKADWTDNNPRITRALESYGRSGVPVYVLYGHGPDAKPVLLPELLTPGILIDALDNINERKTSS
jgi:thiol:disulfide interchange protein DsbD